MPGGASSLPLSVFAVVPAEFLTCQDRTPRMLRDLHCLFSGTERNCQTAEWCRYIICSPEPTIGFIFTRVNGHVAANLLSFFQMDHIIGMVCFWPREESRPCKPEKGYIDQLVNSGCTIILLAVQDCTKRTFCHHSRLNVEVSESSILESLSYFLTAHYT